MRAFLTMRAAGEPPEAAVPLEAEALSQDAVPGTAPDGQVEHMAHMAHVASLPHLSDARLAELCNSRRDLTFTLELEGTAPERFTTTLLLDGEPVDCLQTTGATARIITTRSKPLLGRIGWAAFRFVVRLSSAEGGGTLEVAAPALPVHVPAVEGPRLRRYASTVLAHNERYLFVRPEGRLSVRPPAGIEERARVNEETIRTFETHFAGFRSHMRARIIHEETTGPLEKVRQFDSRTIRFIAEHPEELMLTTARTGIRVGGQHYLPRRTLVHHPLKSFDTAENRAMLGFLKTLAADLEKELAGLESGAVAETAAKPRGGTGAAGSVAGHSTIPNRDAAEQNADSNPYGKANGFPGNAAPDGNGRPQGNDGLNGKQETAPGSAAENSADTQNSNATALVGAERNTPAATTTPATAASQGYIRTTDWLVEQVRLDTGLFAGRWREHLNRAKRLLETYANALGLASSLGSIPTLARIPEPTPAVWSNPVYRILHHAVRRQFENRASPLEKTLLVETEAFESFNTSRLFEYYTQVKLLSALEAAGFVIRRAAGFTYEDTPRQALEAPSFTNTFDLEHPNGTLCRVYAQPVVRMAGLPEQNGLGLARTSPYGIDEETGLRPLKNPVWTPDFVVRVERRDGTASWLVADAKYSRPSKVLERDVLKMIYKYLFALAPTHPGDELKGLWLLCAIPEAEDPAPLFTPEASGLRGAPPVEIMTVDHRGEDTGETDANLPRDERFPGLDPAWLGLIHAVEREAGPMGLNLPGMDDDD